MAQYGFGPGELWAVNNAVTPNRPTKFGTMQGFSCDINFTTKQLMGSYQFPEMVARGPGKISWKADMARINAQSWNEIFFGQAAATAGQQPKVISGEAGTVPGVSAFTITVANSATFVKDLGVRDATTGVALSPVTSGPATGQYSVSAGVYTFASADANRAVVIDYTYNPAGTTGFRFTVANQLLGAAPSFQMVFRNAFSVQGVPKELVMTFRSCMSSQLSFATKVDDFLIPNISGEAFADASNNIIDISLTE